MCSRGPVCPHASHIQKVEVLRGRPVTGGPKCTTLAQAPLASSTPGPACTLIYCSQHSRQAGLTLPVEAPFL